MTDLTLSAQGAEEIQGLSVIGHYDNAVTGGGSQRCQHACHEGKLARQQLPALGQTAPASSAIVKDSRQKELPTPLHHINKYSYVHASEQRLLGLSLSELSQCCLSQLLHEPLTAAAAALPAGFGERVPAW